MRIGITGKLFMAIFATCMLVLITMHWGVRASFERGFIDYIKQSNEQRIAITSSAPVMSGKYIALITMSGNGGKWIRASASAPLST